MRQNLRRTKLALSWIEISLALVLFALALWITAVDWNAGPESDPHGYVAATVFFGLLMALTLLVSGLLLRARTRWSWLPQAAVLGYGTWFLWFLFN